MLGIFFLLFVFLIGNSIMGSEDAAFDYSARANITDTYPYDDATFAAFTKNEKIRLTEPSTARCALDPLVSQAYVEYFGFPVEGTFLIVPDPQRAPDYVAEDPVSGMTFLPAYVVPSGKNAFTETQQIITGQAELPDGECPGRMLLGFAPGEVPTDVALVKVYGALYTISDNLPLQSRTAQDGSPVPSQAALVIGRWEESTPSQIDTPARDQQILNIAIKRDSGIIRLRRVEYAADQTRIFLELANKDNQDMAPYPVFDIQAQQEGNISAGSRFQPIAPNDGDNLDADDSGPNPVVLSIDAFPDSEPVPPVTSGVVRGYVTFKSLRADRPIKLILPDFVRPSAYDFNSVQKPITVRIPPLKRDAR